MSLTTPLLVRDHGFIEFHFVGVTDNLLVLSVVKYDTGVTPTEFVHAPEGVERQEETVNRVPKRGRQREFEFLMISRTR